MLPAHNRQMSRQMMGNVLRWVLDAQRPSGPFSWFNLSTMACLLVLGWTFMTGAPVLQTALRYESFTSVTRDRKKTGRVKRVRAYQVSLQNDLGFCQIHARWCVNRNLSGKVPMTWLTSTKPCLENNLAKYKRFGKMYKLCLVLIDYGMRSSVI